MKRPKPKPNIPTVHDYNGTGKWSREEILLRYKEYARQERIKSPADLAPHESKEGATRWVYPVMDRIIEAIEAGDAAAIQIGIELIEEDQKFPFGRLIKSNTARALRRAALKPEQVERVRKRIIQMLLDGQVPHEYQEYAKLLRKVGVGDGWAGVEERVNRSNPYVMRYYRYFTRHILQGGKNG